MNSAESIAKSQPGMEKIPKSEKIFKYATYICLIIIGASVPGFINFRQFCDLKGYYAYQMSGFAVMMGGFFTYFAAKYSYYSFVKEMMRKLVKQKYQGIQKERKVQLFQKLSFDFLFYSLISIYAYLKFKDQYWFPQILGGRGKCIQIYQDYPNWPAEKRPDMQNYFCFQMGVHLFSLFELMIVRRAKERKYYEWMLHHIVAVALICLSLMVNEIIIGIMILIVHDVSDATLSSGRFFVEANISPKIKNMYTEAFVALQVVSSWVFFRIYVYPCCLISSIYHYIPTPQNDWYFIYSEYMILFVFTVILFFMHVYWLLYLVKALMAFKKDKKIVNEFDNHTEK